VRTLLVVATLVVLGLAGRADAYPQFQLSYDQQCTGCHLSPAGGGLLNENGLVVAEGLGQLTTAPEFFYNNIPTPSWLTLGGDLRSAGGFMSTPEKVLAWFPMQVELHAAFDFGAFSIHGTVGARPAQFGNEAATRMGSREHYLMWRQEPETHEGLYVRAGRFMPVFGLRLAEHPVYVRRYGGTPLFADTYAGHVAYIRPTFEAHGTVFIDDPLISPVSHDKGVAGYGELRLSETASVGGELMATRGPDDKEFRYGVTGKVHIPAAKLLLQTEVQLVNTIIDRTATNPDGGAPLQLVGYLLGSVTLADFLLLDIGVGHYDSNIRIKDLDRDALDINLHYFMDSHLELVLNTRLEMMAFGNGGPTSGYSLVQLHYRL